MGREKEIIKDYVVREPEKSHKQQESKKIRYCEFKSESQSKVERRANS